MWIALLVVGLLLVAFALPVFAIIGAVDAWQFAEPVWTTAGYRRSHWTWQAAGVVCPIVAVGYTGTYFFRVRPRLQGARLALEFAAVEHARQVAHDNPDAVAAANELKTDGPIRVRLSVPYATLPVVAIFVYPFVNLALQRPHTANSFMSSTMWWSLVALYVATIVVSVGLWRWVGITLTATEAVVHTPARRRRLPWAAVVGVSRERFLGGSRVRLWTADGGSVALRAPVVSLGLGRKRFDRDYAVIGDWWLSHRLPSSV